MDQPAHVLRRAVAYARRNVHVGHPPLHDQAARWSAIAPLASADDELVRIALAAAEKARHVDLGTLSARARRAEEAAWVLQWPGEHYRFLAALVETMRASNVVEIGTFTGLSALAMLTALPDTGRLTTFDLVPWEDIDGTALRSDDFGGRLVQHIGDLSDPATFEIHRELLTGADVIFIDGPKDRRFERTLLSMLLPVLTTPTLMVMDDIRVLEMIDVWERITARKLDVTSFGHWSGTGLVAPV